MNDTEFCNNAEDTTIFACDPDVNKVQYKLDADASHLTKWIVDNYLMINDAKCYLMMLGNNSPGISVNVGSSCME